MKNLFGKLYGFNLLALTAWVGLIGPGKSNDLPISDFGVGSYGSWVATGTAFRNGPFATDRLRQFGIENAVDGAVASTKSDGDGPTGILTSPEFKVSRKYLSFLISGGDYERYTCLNLVIRGNVVRSATGRNSDRLASASWDVGRFQGQWARVEIVDHASGDWGHINVDRVIQTDQPEQLPVTAGPLYQEPLRPQFHFTARQWTMNRLNPVEHQEGWVNDLNGLIYYDSEYHLFAQRWATCWIHAVSKDLVHWTELQPAFWEEKLDSGVQSGTCVVDYQNTSGLGKDKSAPPLIAFWSRFDNLSQCICYSLDHGRTWTHYDKNPIMDHPERDPKVFWYAPGKHWVMIMYGDGQYHVLNSKNLLDWTDMHHPIHDSFECPDFFELPIDGNKDHMKWVLIQGNGQYSIGTFDGAEFKEETKRFPCDVGPNFYATQSWANTDTGDGRRIQTAWMRGSVFPEMPFNQQISFPCELTLHSTPDGLRVYRQPIYEVASLQKSHEVWKNHEVKAGEVLPIATSGDLFRIEADVTISEGAKLLFNIRGVPVTLTSKTLESGNSPASVQGAIRHVEILVDRGSIEAFANYGEISSTRFVLPKENGLSATADGGSVMIHSLTVHVLKSAWPSNPS